MQKASILLLAMIMTVSCAACSGAGESSVSSENGIRSSIQETMEELEAVTPEPMETEMTSGQQGNIVINDNRNRSEETGNAAAVTTKPKIEVSDADFNKTEYRYESMFGDTLWFVAITNNSESTVRISGNAIARDADGNAIGADSLTIDVLGPGESTMEYYYFEDVSGIATVESQYAYDTDPWYSPVLSNLIVEQTLNDGNVTLIVTNHGNSCAQFVEAYALFMDADDNILRYDSTYITDSDSEIKPGATISAQLNSRDFYDHVVVYLSAYRSRWPSCADILRASSAAGFSFPPWP